MNYNDLEDRIKKIKGIFNEPNCDFETKSEIHNLIVEEINKTFDFNISEKNHIDITNLENTGLLNLGNVLSEKKISEILNYFSDKLVYNSHVPHKDSIKFDYQTSPYRHNSYSSIDILNCPNVIELATDKKILQIAEQYLKCTPTLYSINCWWTKSFEGADNNIQKYHRDFDDFKFLTFFIYLNDVDIDTNPHVFVKYTHDKKIFEKKFKNLNSNLFFPPFSISEEMIENNNLTDEIEILEGKKGDGFLVDTYGIHKALGNSKKDRLVLWIRYGTHKNPPTEQQTPNPYFVNYLNNKKINFDEKMKFITRLLIKTN